MSFNLNLRDNPIFQQRDLAQATETAYFYASRNKKAMSFILNFIGNPSFQQRVLAQAKECRQHAYSYVLTNDIIISHICKVPLAILSNSTTKTALLNALSEKDQKSDKNTSSKKSEIPEEKKEESFKIDFREDHFKADEKKEIITADDFVLVETDDTNEKQ